MYKRYINEEMAPRRNVTNISVTEDFVIQTERALNTFLENDKQSLEFPDTLTNVERAWIHTKVRLLGLTSKSIGKEPKRYITVSKPSKYGIENTNRMTFGMSQENILAVSEFLIQYPSVRDKTDHILRHAKRFDVTLDNNMGQLTYGSPQVPTHSFNSDLLTNRLNLPIWPMKEKIMESILSNQVIIVCGETGSGKTTQLPQFILDYSRSCNEKCRIICTQPRRISAVAMAERVAAERAETVGQTVGFHIRLESCVGPKTVLIYCTNGILLRTLMTGDSCLNNYTHIIVDEVHERDRYSDFLLICLRECLVNFPHLRLILMSATMDVSAFKKYFNNAPGVFVAGRQHSVIEYYLQDALKLLNYESTAMKKAKDKMSKIANSNMATPITSKNSEELTSGNYDLDQEMNDCILECFETGSEEAFGVLIQLILSENVPINYQHPETGCTGLMAAALHGSYEIVQHLIKFGANPSLVNKDSNTAYDFARSRQHIHIAQFLQYCQENIDPTPQNGIDNSEQEKKLLDLYQSTVSDALIDFDLMVELILLLHMNEFEGSILVFLPGYDDIVICRDRINADNRFTVKSYQIFTLHGSMQMSDQHKVFNTLENKRKIILSTNIAETSITINDVVYVIDSGKVKEKSYDAIVGVCTLQSVWISQACAKQRAGRAGRTKTGHCFHMFSKNRLAAMQEFSTPEILRMPLHELCLQTKMLAPKEMEIATFLARSLEPPSSVAVKTAIEHLQEIEALDENENLTQLGRHLVDLPVEPRLAKMLIYAVIFKCLDPILTIVSMLAYRDPFLLPNNSNQRALAASMRKNFSSNSFSDHMVLLRAFQTWQESRVSKTERVFCNKNFISSATMEMVVDIRSQLLAQLRACGFVKTRPPGDIRELNANSNNWAIVKAVITAGLYPNIAYINKSTWTIRTKKEKKVLLHHSSSLREGGSHNMKNVGFIKKIPSNWLIYEEMSRAGTIYNIKSATCVSPLTIALFVDQSNGSCLEKSDDGKNAELILNKWITFEDNIQLTSSIMQLREKINNLVTKRIVYPFKNLSMHDETLINLVSIVLTKEDNKLGIVSPPGIGARPKMLLYNNYPVVNDVIKQSQQKSKHTNWNSNHLPDMLCFKKINIPVYNQYSPHRVNMDLPEMSNSSPTSSVCVNEPLIDLSYSSSNYFYNVPPNNFSNLSTVNFESNLQTNYGEQSAFDLASLNQNLLMINLYNNPAVKPDYINPQYYQNSNVRDEFERNGVNVSEDCDVESACALPPINTRSYLNEWINTYCNPAFTSYFIIKAGGMKSVDISISKKTWIFSPQTERKLLKLIQVGRIVVLIFSVSGSGYYQGIARLLGGPASNACDSSNSNNLACPVEWLSRADISFSEVRHLFTPACVDGLELDPEIGSKLCIMFTNCQPKPPPQNEPVIFPMGGRAILGSHK